MPYKVSLHKHHLSIRFSEGVADLIKSCGCLRSPVSSAETTCMCGRICISMFLSVDVDKYNKSFVDPPPPPTRYVHLLLSAHMFLSPALILAARIDRDYTNGLAQTLLAKTPLIQFIVISSYATIL